MLYPKHGTTFIAVFRNLWVATQCLGREGFSVGRGIVLEIAEINFMINDLLLPTEQNIDQTNAYTNFIVWTLLHVYLPAS